MAQAPNMAVIKRRRRWFFLLLLLGLLSFPFAYFYFMPEKKAPGIVRPPGQVAVPVLNQPVKIGSMINPGQIRLQFFDPLEVPQDALLKPFQFQRRLVLRDMLPGEYLTDKDLSEVAAPNSFSGLTKAGMRMVVVETGNISGSVGYLRQGDRVDVLALGWTDTEKAKGSAGLNPRSAGGPGQPMGRLNRGTPGVAPTASLAVILAEAAQVVVAPDVRAGANGHVVLQMLPGEAQKTSLALGNGAVLRLVYRPFNDDSRLVEPPDIDDPIYAPRDYRQVEIIDGTDRKTQTAIFNE